MTGVGASNASTSEDQRARENPGAPQRLSGPSQRLTGLGSRLRGVRWIGAGFADQALIACANAGTTLLVASVIDRTASAAPLLAVSIAYFVIGISRAFVGEVFAALASRHDGEKRDRLVRDGLTTAALIGTVACVVFVALWVFWPNRGQYDLSDLIWLAPFMPFVLVQDAGRYSHLADREPAKALAIDLVWVGVQAVLAVGSLLTIGPSAAALLAAWGCGATASAIAFVIRTRPGLRGGDPRRWIRQTRRLSGWFTATALVGQIQALAVNFLVIGRVSERGLSGLRTAQTVLLQPVQNFQLAVQGLLVPRMSRLAGKASGAMVAASPPPVDSAPEAVPAGPSTGTEPEPVAGVVTTAGAGDPDESFQRADEAARRLRRQVIRLVLSFAVLAILMISVVWPVASVVLRHIPKFSDLAPLALPLAIQGGIYLVQVPFTAAMRATHQARSLLVQYVTFTTVSLTGLVIGAGRAGLAGAVWGLVTGSAVGFVVMVGLCWLALRNLSAPARELTPRSETALMT